MSVKNILNKKINIPVLSKVSKLFIYACISVLIIAILFPTIKFLLLGFENPVNPETFKKVLLNGNCELKDVSKTTSNENIDFYYETVKESCPYEVSYIIINDKGTRNDYYSLLEEKVYDNDNMYTYSYVDSINYSANQTEGNNYKAIIMVDDSIFYISTNLSFKNKALDIQKELGYKKIEQMSVTNLDIIVITMWLLIFASWWKINVKIGRKGWICLIPYYNIICLTKDVFGKWYYCLLLLVPIGNAIFIAMLFYKLSKLFGKTTTYSVLSIFLFLILIPYLAIDDSKYIGPIKK